VAGRRTWRASGSFGGAVALVTIVAVGSGALVSAAYQHATPAAGAGAPAPVPTFDLGVQTPTPTPTPEPTPEVPRESERFLAVGTGVGSNVWWRGIAGSCGGNPPVVERSTDGGTTWTDVTPLYLGAAQLVSLDTFEQTEAELIVGIGPDCEPAALRTYTHGQFWDFYPDALATARFVAPVDAATVQQPSSPAAAPCADARGMRAEGDLVALVCDSTAYISRAGGEWDALPAPDASAVAIKGDGVLVAHTADGCNGLELTRYAGADAATAEQSLCMADLIPTDPLAIAATDAGPLVWSGGSNAIVP
jgi:hypothetical protein